MADRTSIEWTDATWNTIGGCTRVDEGCRNCYAEVMAARFNGPGQWGEGLAQIVTSGGVKDHRWTGKVTFRDDALTAPLRWKRPRRIFVNSTADTFHESVPDEWIDRIFAVMALCPQHQFQVLTKRPERARAYLAGAGLDLGQDERMAGIAVAAQDITRIPDGHPAFDAFGDPEEPNAVLRNWPLPNVWLGTSVSDQASADARIPELLACPAAVRFISAEPLLGPVDITHITRQMPFGVHEFSALECDVDLEDDAEFRGACLDWVIVGGESGPGARPMHPDWARSLRDQCQAAGVAFFFKQWGEWAPVSPDDLASEEMESLEIEGKLRGFHDQPMLRTGKARAGRLLDGREWNQMPGAQND